MTVSTQINIAGRTIAAQIDETSARNVYIQVTWDGQDLQPENEPAELFWDATPEEHASEAWQEQRLKEYLYDFVFHTADAHLQECGQV